jgi:large subunit ribosomal protein L4
MIIIPKDLEAKTSERRVIGLIHKVYTAKLLASKKRIASTKTRSEVSGGGKKPWKQKGTGRARAGSIRSPIWAGGGVTFGPKPRIITRKINKKENRLAITAALKLKDLVTVIVPEEMLFASVSNKTQVFYKTILEKEALPGLLIITSDKSDNLNSSIRNIPKISTKIVEHVCVKDILNATRILITEEALDLFLFFYEIRREKTH